MNLDQLTDAELDARFEAAFAATHPPKVIDVYRRTLRQRWECVPFLIKLPAIMAAAFLVPWAIVMGGLAVLAAWDALTGR